MTDLRPNIVAALQDFDTLPLPEAASRLFQTLGYASDRRLPIATTAQFVTALDPAGKLTDREREAFDNLTSIHLLFQITDTELDVHGDLFADQNVIETTKIESYLFFAAELPAGHYPRATLSALVRAINKPLPMPALVLFRHGDAISIGIIHRRLHKRDQSKDVLEKVTLIKDIACADPIRAHVEILNDFVLVNLDAEFNVPNFVSLHDAWQKRLGAYALSNDFYREIADWYFWAHHQVDDGTIRLPQHCDTEQEKSLFLIRLLTRVIFSWFLVEKRLIPNDLFRQHRLKALLKDFQPSHDPKKPDTSPAYYRTILQNLFFGTLNMPPEQRAFREKRKPGEKYDQNYGITNLWRYETSFRTVAAWLELAKRIPFLNGGLFDCLDDKTGKKKDNSILDGFSDREAFGCHLPNDLFFGPERTVDLSHDYGEDNKRTARSRKAKVRGLIEILSRYKFTIEENTPLEEEIALDPELLGKVFENLLASYNEDTRTTARKALGAFYTPREIVTYMVDEALKSYLATQVPRCKGALEDLFSNKATLKELKPDTRDALIAAIGRVRILDPACGSGAFPMGALHRLVDLLQKLDPNNESWKRDRLAEARRYRQLIEEAGAATEEVAACDARIVDIEKSFDSRFHALDFARKLYLIENSIYGVDIQPIATQIAKLRFFISLVVDQKVDTKAPNLGVRPLPNLETRLVAADTLIPIEKAESDLFSGEVDRLRNELATIRHEHFNARSPATKRKWRDADAAKRQEIAALLEREHAIPRDSARKLAAWDPYDQNTHASFFDSEWMFGIPVGKIHGTSSAPATLLGSFALINEVAGQTELTPLASGDIYRGFDVIIGNPPYVSSENFARTAQQAIWRAFYDCFASRIDIYCLFYERGLSLLKPTGVLAFISSNKFLRAGYGVKFRPLLSTTTTIDRIVDFGELPVFAAATDTAIVIVQRGEPRASHKFLGASIKEASELASLPAAVRLRGVVLEQASLKKEGWTFEQKSVLDLMQRIREAGAPLEQVVEKRFFYGIKTGLNEAFVIDAETRTRLVSEDKKSAELIMPWLQGREIKRWYGEPSGLFVLVIRNGFHSELSKYPAILAHLKRYEKQLKDRGQCKTSRGGQATGQHHWLELDNNPSQDYLRWFDGTKIVFNETSKELHAFVDRDGLYVNKTGFILITDTPEFVLAVLMSKVLDWLYRMEFPNWGDPWNGGRIQFRGDRMAKVPIASATQAQQSTLTSLAVGLAFLNRQFAHHPATQDKRDPLMLAYWERMLNGLVYELYFPDEVHGAGLRLFDLVTAARIPDINSIPESARLQRLRTLFETLYDGTHPLRIALDKLQTLDTVRIIEGKA